MSRYCEYLDHIESTFGQHFSQKNYKREKPVAVSSGVDRTVDLVGSKISPLKHYLLKGNIDRNGHFLIQDCFRTRGIKQLHTLEPSKFGSCFRIMGTLTNPDLEKIIFDTFDYLINGIGIPPQDLLIKVNSDDIDLLEAIISSAGDIRREENSTDAHYRHKYGLDELGIFGRDFNIAVRSRETGQFVTVGTVVLIEQNTTKVGVDMGIGNLSLSMCEFGKSNTVSASRMADVIDVDGIETQRLADSLMGLALLQKEGVQNLSTHTDKLSKKLRSKLNKYEEAVQYWMSELGLSTHQVLDYMQSYIDLEFKNNNYKSEATWLKK